VLKFEPKLSFLADIAAIPDSYDNSSGLMPPDDFIVSRHRDGSIASRFRDTSWNFTAYDPEGRRYWLHFPYREDDVLSPVRAQLVHEAQWLMFLLIWKRKGSPLSNASLTNYLSLLRAVTYFCEANNCRIQDVFCDEDRFSDFLCSYRGSELKQLAGLMSILLQLGANQVGFSVLGRKAAQKAQELTKKATSAFQQYPPIPTRIYSAIMTNLAKEIADFESVSDRYFAVVSMCSKDVFLGRCLAAQANIAKRSGMTSFPKRTEFFELLKQYDLEGYFTTKGLAHSLHGLAVGLSEVQAAIKLQAQLFSGMRDDEASSLPYYCLEKTSSNGRSHYLLLGRTTKLNKGQIKRTRWVTNSEAYAAVELAQRIADVIYYSLDVIPQKDDRRINNFPLFVSVAYLPFSSGCYNNKNTNSFLPKLFQFSNFERLQQRLLPLIEDGDLCELEQIDPHRAWRSEERFGIGKPWPLTSHQFRRSLALYAQRSGLVSLPSLRRQLQHLTEEMSRYYARGSVFAKDFIGNDKKHFGIEWQEMQPISAGLGYILNVLIADGVLFGGHATWVDKCLRDSTGAVVFDRETTMGRFKKGELSYRETILGGCTKVGDCDDVVIKWLDIECLKGCPNMVVKLPNLERIIAAQTRLVSSLTPGSLEHRSEQADLEALLAFREKVIKKIEKQRGAI
jgi:hypothetical protein